MPIVRYKLQIMEDVFSETVTLPHGSTSELIERISKEVVRPMQQRREALGEPTVSLLAVETINPFIHEHDWRQLGRVDKYALKVHYRCAHCGITGFRPYHLLEGESKASITRNPGWEKQKYELCRDVLKSLPKKIVFG